MTTIAWDGKTLAADKRSASKSGPITIITKIFNIDGVLVGTSGAGPQCSMLLDWAKTKFDPEKYPFKDPKEYSRILVINQDKTVLEYDTYSKYPEVIENPFYAIGSGRAYAMAAMHCGKTAIEAVEIAAAYDINSGNGIDTLTLDDAVTTDTVSIAVENQAELLIRLRDDIVICRSL